jgi:hypothetical protein
MEEQNKEVKTEKYEDVKAMQEAIVKNSNDFERLGLSKIKGSNRTIEDERKRLSKVLQKDGKAQCDACNQTITEIISTMGVSTIDETSKTSKEAERIKNFAKKGTTCSCCGNKAEVKKHTLNINKAIALIEIVKFYRHHPDSDINKYYTKEDFFQGNLEEYGELFEGFEELHLWDLMSRMPTRPDKVVYKEGYFGITENGIKFVQREIGVPKTAYSYNEENDSFESDFITIEDLINEAKLKYDDLIKVEEND